MQGTGSQSRFIVGDGNELLLFRSWRAGARAPAAFVGHSQPTHSGNVVDLAAALCRGGFNVGAGDLRGHGASVSARQPHGHLDAESGWDALIDDFRRLTDAAFEGAAWEDRLVVAPNISALLTLELLKVDPGLARHIVLISPPPNQKVMSLLARSFVKARMLIRDAADPDEQTLHHLYTFLGAQLKHRRHLADVTTADRETVEALISDPLAWPTPTLGYWSSIFRGFQQAWEWPAKARVRDGTRVLLMYGGDDPMMGKGGFVRPMHDWLSARGIGDVTAFRVEGARSALFLDERRLGVSPVILGWVRDGGLPLQATEPTVGRVEDISSRILKELGITDDADDLRPDELVELCYNAIQDETRWAEMLHRIALAIARDGAADERQVDTIVSGLMPHWNRSYELNRQIMTNAALGVVLQSVIERFDISVALVANDLTVVHSNASFRDMLARCADSPDLPESEEAATAILRAIAPPSFRSQIEAGRDEALLLVNDDPVGLYFRPQALRQTGLLRGGPSGVLVLRKAQGKAGEDVRNAMLQLAYGLTQQEARVALGLAAGKSPEAISEGLELSIHTVRTHLKRCYDKMGVQGQTELTARILNGPIGLLGG